MDIKNLNNKFNNKLDNIEAINTPEKKKKVIKILVIIVAVLLLLTLLYLFTMRSGEKNIAKTYRGEYVTYSSKSLDDIKGRNTVLFFYDDESVKSRVIDATIKDGGDKPDNLKIIKVDMYDHEDIKKKYSIEESNTMIKIDDNGKETKRSMKPTNISEIVEFVK